jgi:hypothetical protein
MPFEEEILNCQVSSILLERNEYNHIGKGICGLGSTRSCGAWNKRGGEDEWDGTKPVNPVTVMFRDKPWTTEGGLHNHLSQGFECTLWLPAFASQASSGHPGE